MNNINPHYISYGIIVIIFLSLHIIIGKLHAFLTKRYSNLDDEKLLGLYEDKNLKLWFYSFGSKKIIKGSVWNYVELHALVNTMKRFHMHHTDGHVYDYIQTKSSWSESFKYELIKEIYICLDEKKKYVTRGVILMAFVLFFAVCFI